MRKNQIKSLYNNDIYLWTNQQVNLLKKHDFSNIDLKNIIEEIESLGTSQKSAIKSYLRRWMKHMLKENYVSHQKGNSKSWDGSIRDSIHEIKDLIETSPSLKNHLKSIFNKIYEEAYRDAAIECNVDEDLFPKECPWKIKDILGKDFKEKK